MGEGTISIVVSILDIRLDTAIFIDRADFALYHAKLSDRNRIILCDQIDREGNLTINVQPGT